MLPWLDGYILKSLHNEYGKLQTVYTPDIIMMVQMREKRGLEREERFRKRKE